MILSDLIDLTSAINHKRIALSATEICVVFEDEQLSATSNENPEPIRTPITSVTLKNGQFYSVLESYDEIKKLQEEKFEQLVKGQ